MDQQTPDFAGLLYVSHRAPRLSDTQIVDDIVLPAGAKNRRLEITGCLWFGKSRFAQILEGEPARVAALYETIRQDHRHNDVRLIWTGPIPAHQFPRWGMRHIEGNESDIIAEIIAPFDDLQRRPPEPPSAPNIASKLTRAFLRLKPAK